MAKDDPLARWARNGLTVGANRSDARRTNFDKLNPKDSKNQKLDEALGKCSECSGSGKKFGGKCNKCKGTGKAE